MEAFAISRGLIIKSLRRDGKWHRVPTEDKPKKRNGAYCVDGNTIIVRNWATMLKAEAWRGGEVGKVDRAQMFEDIRRREQEERAKHAKGARIAAGWLEDCSLTDHGYLASKKINTRGFVRDSGELIIPMRDMNTNELINAQRIAPIGQTITLASGDQVTKAFAPGARVLGATYKIGRGKEVWLCEGFATAWSLHEALRSLYREASVWATFTAANMVYIAEHSRERPTFVFADHDPINAEHPERGETGQKAATKTGLPWVMSPVSGEDANDAVCARGVAALAKILREFLASR